MHVTTYTTHLLRFGIMSNALNEVYTHDGKSNFNSCYLFSQTLDMSSWLLTYKNCTPEGPEKKDSPSGLG